MTFVLCARVRLRQVDLAFKNRKQTQTVGFSILQPCRAKDSRSKISNPQQNLFWANIVETPLRIADNEAECIQQDGEEQSRPKKRMPIKFHLT